MWAEINFRLLCSSALPSKDLHYVAEDKGELVLAAVAKKKANEIDAEAQTSAPGERIILVSWDTIKRKIILSWCDNVYECTWSPSDTHNNVNNVCLKAHLSPCRHAHCDIKIIFFGLNKAGDTDEGKKVLPLNRGD